MAKPIVQMVVIIVTWLSCPVTTENLYSIDEAYLFDKSREMNRIDIKNQIGYHFQRDVIQEVTRELFITRLLNISSLFTGLAILNETADNVRKYCGFKMSQEVQSIGDTSITTSFSKGKYHYIKGVYSLQEAKAKCLALGKQLPEVYHKQEAQDLKSFMEIVGVKQIFAGIEYDPANEIFRFASTGYPSWMASTRISPGKGPSDTDYKTNTPGWTRTIFVYEDGKLGYSWPFIQKTNETSHWPHAEDEKIVENGIVCQNRWDGSKIDLKWKNPNSNVTDDHSKRIRDAPTSEPEDASDKQLKAFCYSLADQISEFHKDNRRKLNNLLALVDIETISETQLERNKEGSRDKRFASLLGKLALRKGTKLLWNLFGFYQQVRTERKIKKNTKDIENLKTRVDNVDKTNLSQEQQIEYNRKTIREATRILQENSIAIAGLTVVVRDLEDRVQQMQNNLVLIQHDINKLKDQTLVMSTLMLVNSMAMRIITALDNGYEQLSEIIHTSLLGQTSPLVLPIKQIEEVQQKLSAIEITAALDKDYSRMKSVVTTDPNDPSNLLVIVNAVAVSHKKLELVRLIPIPAYDSTKAYFPSTDYEYVALDHKDNKFTVLSSDEANSCISGKCYISQMEQSVFSNSCGMPQYFDQSEDACDMESMYHNGLFIQSASPDGVIFSFRENITMSMYCNNNNVAKKTIKIKGAGKMFVPPGCTINAYDAKGQTVTIKGGPSHDLIEVSKYEFITETLVVGSESERSIQGEPKRPSAEEAMEQKLHIVQESMETANKRVASLQQRMWITVGCLIAIIAIIAVIIAILYRYSRRFQHRFKKVIGSFVELRDKLLELDKVKAAIAFVTPRLPARFAPSAPPRIRIDDTSDYLHLQAQVEENDRIGRPRRIYDRVPLSQSINLPPRTPRLPRINTFGNAARLSRDPRLYPECPKKTSSEDLREQCASVEELSLITHKMMNECSNLPDYSSDEDTNERK